MKLARDEATLNVKFYNKPKETHQNNLNPPWNPTQPEDRKIGAQALAAGSFIPQ